MSTRRPIRTALLASAALLLAAWAAPVGAQEADGRWLPWVGCWEPVGETADGSLLCVRQAQGGVEVVTFVDDEATGAETLRADGLRHDTEREGCRGWNAARFSSDARRVYVDSEHRCEGETTRVTTGLIAMTSPHEWIEVEAIDVGQRSIAWVKRYRATDFETAAALGFGDVLEGRGLAIESARMAASAPIRVEDLIEASELVDAEAVEAWIAETGDPIDLDAEGLLALADAGVPERVIDVAVALSYPEHFAVDREARPRDRTAYMDYYGHRPVGWFGYYGSRYYSPYYGFYGSPWSYGGWGYGYRPSIVVVQPKGGLIQSGGRVLSGRGYSRGRTSSGTSAPPAASSGRGGSGSSAAPPPSTGSSSSGGRKAKPRSGPPPGGF